MGTATEILPVLTGLPGRIERKSRFRIGIQGALGIIKLVLIALLLQFPDALGTSDLVATEGTILLDNSGHLFLDRLEILTRYRAVRRHGHVVVEALVYGRPVDQLDSLKYPLDRLRHDVGAGVPQQVESIRIGLSLPVIRGDDRERTVPRKLSGEIAQDAVDLAAKSLLREAGANIAGDLERRNRGVVAQFRSIWKSDDWHERLSGSPPGSTVDSWPKAAPYCVLKDA